MTTTKIAREFVRQLLQKSPLSGCGEEEVGKMEEYAQQQLETKQQQPLRYPPRICRTSHIEWPYIPEVMQKVVGVCDFHGCSADAIVNDNRPDITRCELHQGCCTYIGCALPAEFKVRQYRNRCCLHDGAPACLHPECKKLARELTGLCGSHEQKHYEQLGIACTYPGCTESRISTRPNRAVCGGPFERCAKHGGVWFCRAPQCISLASAASGVALLCDRHFKPRAAMLALQSTCSWHTDSYACTAPIGTGGSKRDGLCLQHYRCADCKSCGKPQSCVSPDGACVACTRRENKTQQLDALTEAVTNGAQELDSCPLCQRTKWQWCRVCPQCVSMDTCIGCYGPKTKTAEYCRACRKQYTAILFKLAEHKFASALQQAGQAGGRLSEYARYSAQDMQLTCSSPRCRRRPDFIYVLVKHAVVVELDEHYHARYKLQQEFERLAELACELWRQHQLGLHVIRVNSEFYRMETVLRLLQTACTTSPCVYKCGRRVVVDVIGYPDKRFECMKQKEHEWATSGKENVEIVVGLNHEAYINKH